MLKDNARYGTKDGVATLMHLTLGADVGKMEPLPTNKECNHANGAGITNACWWV